MGVGAYTDMGDYSGEYGVYSALVTDPNRSTLVHHSRGQIRLQFGWSITGWPSIQFGPN